MKRLFICVYFCSIVAISTAQELKFDVRFNNESLVLNKEYSLNGQPITFSTCKFYISNFRYGEQHPTANYHLIDLENPASLTIVSDKKFIDFNNVSFNLGIDSTKSVSGVFGEDLDPTNGMYWAWNSGYINCKIEGNSHLCPSRKNKFQFHLGGYAYPYNTLQTVEIKNIRGNRTIVLDLDKLLSKIDITKTYQVMSPNQNAMKLSRLFAQSFRVDE